MKRAIFVAAIAFSPMAAYSETVQCKSQPDQLGWTTTIEVAPFSDYSDVLGADITDTPSQAGRPVGSYETVNRYASRGFVLYRSNSYPSAFELKIAANDVAGSDVPASMTLKLVGETQKKNLTCSFKGEVTGTFEKCPAQGSSQINKNLIRAIEEGTDKDVTQAFICGAQANAKDSRGCTPLLKLSDTDCGAKPASQRIESSMSLSISTLIKQLKNMGADLEAKDPVTGETTAIKFTRSEDTNSLEDLIDAGANIDAQDFKGNTALMAAADSGSKDVVEAVLYGNPNPNIKNKKGERAYDIAKKNGYTKLLDLLAPAAQSVTVQGQADGSCTPTMIHVYAGKSVEITLKANSTDMFLFSAPDFSLELMAMPGESVKKVFTPTKQGNVPFTCGVHGASDDQQTHGTFMVM